jgi:hypothetical protein
MFGTDRAESNSKLEEERREMGTGDLGWTERLGGDDLEAPVR